MSSVDDFLKSVRTGSLSAPASQDSFVQGVCHHVTSGGIFFTVDTWDGGKFVFGPAPWSGGPVAPPVGAAVLVVFVGGGIDTPWVFAPTSADNIAGSLLDAKGDLIVATGDNTPARLPVGTNGQRLEADSTATAGVAWKTPRQVLGAGAPAGTGTNGDEYWDTTNKRLYRSDGVGWIIMAEETQTYVPTFANTTLGNGVRTGSYHRSDGWCDFLAQFDLGSTSAMGTNPTVTFPITPASISFAQVSLGVWFAGVFLAAGMTGSSNPLDLYVIDTTGSKATATAITSTSPSTWAVNYRLVVTGRYRMTTRYS